MIIILHFLRVDDSDKSNQKNNTLFYFVISNNEIEDQNASQLSELNLKGINVDHARISP